MNNLRNAGTWRGWLKLAEGPAAYPILSPGVSVESSVANA